LPRLMVLELTAAWALALSGLGPVHPIGGATVFGRCLQRSPVCPRLRMGLAEAVDEETFDNVRNYDGLAVVKFYAPWCRTCRTVEPVYERIINKIENEHKGSVKFFEVNFKEHKSLCLRERVFALPAIHFYARDLGRINRFTLSPTTASKKMRRELERYLGGTDADDASGHLALLKTLSQQQPETEKDTVVSPLRRYKNLVGLLQALENAANYADVLQAKDGAYISDVLEEDERRINEYRSLFEWIDANSDGVIDADELAAVAAAVSPLSGDDGAVGDASFYGALMEKALAREDDPKVDAEPMQLEFASFLRLMSSKAVADFRNPENELQPAFSALDVDGDGLISREELTQALDMVCRTLPPGHPCSADAGSTFVADTISVFDALDRDRSGSLDYEEFVAMLSDSRPLE